MRNNHSLICAGVSL